jgi:UrcA family protein
MQTVHTWSSIRTPRRRILLFALCAALGATAAGSANAAAADDVPAVTVHFKPDSLSTDSGARAIYWRLVNAAEKVCPDDAVGTRFVSNSVRQCREQAVARAVRQINNSRLAAVHANRTKSG